MINSRNLEKTQGILGKTQGILGKTQGMFTKSQGILQITQSFANLELEIVAEKRPKKPGLHRKANNNMAHSGQTWS